MTTRWRLVLAVAVLVVLAASVGRSEWERHEVDQARDTARAELTGRRLQVVAAEQQRAATAALDRQVAGEATATDAALGQRTAERDGLRIEGTAVGDQIAATEQRLAVGTFAEQLQRAQLEGVDRCLGGVRQARDHAAGGRYEEANAAMRDVQSTCRDATASLRGGKVPDFPYDFADPFVLRHGDTYYAYATNGPGGYIQTITSTDLHSWTLVGTALLGLPPWAAANATWAPAVLERDGVFVLYYTAREKSSRRQCISTAWSLKPEGPFVDDTTAPTICQRERGGSIDPSPYVAPDGGVRLVWKSEDDTRGGKARIWSVGLWGDWRTPLGEPKELLVADRESELGTIEAPALVDDHGTLYLLYSANRWFTNDYRVDYAVCEGPEGPCKKPADNTALAAHDLVGGPGGAEVVRSADGTPYLSFHAWTWPDIGFPNKRQLHVERLTFDPEGRPAVGG